ncbi:MAG: hypothetical protein FWE13_02215 [Firmicutes bacterium]|nr:hypothetical protein [Bacillota bacterium]
MTCQKNKKINIQDRRQGGFCDYSAKIQVQGLHDVVITKLQGLPPVAPIPKVWGR